MRLSDLISKVPDIELVKDKDYEFTYLDYSNSRLEDKVLTFIDDDKYIRTLSKSVSCVICNKTLETKIPSGIGVLTSNNPRLAFYKIHNYLSVESRNYGSYYRKTSIGRNCKISEKAVISNNNVVIGNNVIIEEFVIIRENVFIGDNTIIRAGSIIGGEGFQFNKQGETFFIIHHGGVIIKSRVEIQYNDCVDRAIFPWDNTIIGNNTKLDNHIHVGHAVKIGDNCLLAASASIGGSTIIGDNCWIGVGATISNGLVVGENASIKIGSVVTKDVETGMSVSGNFAIEHSKFLKFIKSIR